MIGYVTLGTNKFDGAAKFYDELFATIGAGRIMESDTFIAWSSGPKSSAVSITRPFDGNDATAGNGTMVAIKMDDTAAVDAFYAKAIALGGADEGEPGKRLSNFYAGYFRDLDGNKLNAFCFVDE